MSDIWTCEPVTRPIDATAEVPGSKSLTNRALVIAALAGGRCRLSNVLFADDTRFMLDNLAALGLKMEVDEAARTVAVDAPGSPDFAAADAVLHCGNSGTTIRFLTALLAAAGDASFSLDGVPRMRERPAGPMVDLLNALGAKISYGGRDGYPPLKVDARGGLAGGPVTYPAGQTLSSQFLSAVLMAAPRARREVRVGFEGVPPSWPYVRMTMRLMDGFGVTPEVEISDRDLDRDDRTPRAVVVPRGRYAGTDYDVEPDASAASYFLGLAAIHPGGRVTVPGLGTDGLQGDAAFAGLLERMGCRVEQSRDATTVYGPRPAPRDRRGPVRRARLRPDAGRRRPVRRRRDDAPRGCGRCASRRPTASPPWRTS